MPRKGENIRRRKDGRWEGRYLMVHPLTGKKVYRSVYAQSYAEVKERLIRAKTEAKHLTPENMSIEPKSADIRFDTAAEQWLESIKTVRKYSTYIKYRQIYEKHLYPILRICPLSDISEDTGGLLTAGARSDSLCKSICSVTNQILSFAEGYYHTKLCRVCMHTKGAASKPIEALSRKEQILLLEFLREGITQKPDPCKVGVLICLFTGLRLGEICALKWSDIDMCGRLLYVRRTVQRVCVDQSGGGTVLLEGEPKSPFSRRTIPLPEQIADIFALMNRNQEYVISGTKATEPRTYQMRFHRYLAEAGIEKKNFHILRHTFATNCVDSGIDPKCLSELLGHSDVAITLNRYVHPGIETKRQHLNRMSSIYGQNLGQQQNIIKEFH